MAALQLARHDWQRNLMHRLSACTKEAKQKAQMALQTEHRTRATAYQYLRGLDHQLGLMGIPLSRFLAVEGDKASGGPLGPSESRSEVPFREWPYNVSKDILRTAKRFVITDATTQQSRWEVQEFSGGRRPLLTVTGDQGGSGLPSWMFMCGAMKMRCLMAYGRFHRVNRDWRLALGENNLWCIILEVQVCMDLVFGPWKSESWWVQVVEAAASYVETCGAEDLAWNLRLKGALPC